jgi:cytochrome P450
MGIGPIIRINPHELSVHDPEFYNELYVSGSVRRTENYSHFVKGIDFDGISPFILLFRPILTYFAGSHFLTTTHDLHRRRRKPLEPYFSRLGVIKLQPILADLTRKLTCRLEALKGSKTVIRLDHAYFAFSGDVIGRICCDDIPEFLEDQDFAPHWYESFIFIF